MFGNPELESDFSDRRDRAFALVGGQRIDDETFLPNAVEAIATFLGCRWAGIGQLGKDGKQIDIKTIFDAEGSIVPFSYPIEDSPCGQVYAADPMKPFRLFQSEVTKQFTGPPFLKNLGIEGYIGEAIYDADGDVFGHTFAISTEPIEGRLEHQQFFRLVSHWIGTVLVQRRSQELLEQSEDRFRKVIDEVVDGIAMHNMDGQFIDVNEQLARSLGYTRNELLSMHVWDVEVGVTKKQVQEAWRAAVPGEPVKFDGCHKRKDGSLFPVDVRGRLVNVGSEPMMIVSARDVTESKAVEAELSRARQEAEAASQAKSNFIANVSHELRTPLNAIIGFSDVMLKSVFGKIDNPRYREYISDINQSGRHLLELISDLLDLSKIEAGKETIADSLVDPRRLIDECLSLIAGQAGDKEVEISLSFDPKVAQIRVDPSKFRQIVLNILSNAVKFSPSNKPVALAIEGDVGGGATLTVLDHGVGIPADQIEHAFEAFRQLEPKNKSAEEGTGLGLPIARGIAALHGGTLHLESKVGEGTMAILTLPSDRVILSSGTQ